MKANAAWKGLQVIARVATTLLFDLKVYGMDRLPLEGGVLVVSNHQSYLDPVLLGVRSRRPLSYMARSGLFDNRFFARFIRWLGAFPVKQGAGDIRAMKEAIERVQAGDALTVFPEGSRTEDGRLLPIEPGIALIIRKARVPVVPAVIHGSYEAWPKENKLFRPHKIRVLYDNPMNLSHLSRDEIVKAIEGKFAEMFNRLKEDQVP